MDEREAYDLFAPARERTLPQPRISMAEVYEAHARRQRAQRWLAIGSSVSVVLLVMAGSFWTTRGGTRGAAVGASPSSGPAHDPDLVGALRQVVVPPDAVRSTASPSPEPTTYGEIIGDYRWQAWTWATSISPEAAIALVKAHPPQGMTTNTSGGGTLSPGVVMQSITYQGQPTPDHSAIQLDISAQAAATGPTTLRATAWSVIRKPKPAEALINGTVTSMTAETSPVAIPPRETTESKVPLAESQKIASMINAAYMATWSGRRECGPNPHQTTLTFHTSDSDRLFTLSCGFLVAGRGPDAAALEVTPALSQEIGTVTAGLFSKPSPSFAPTLGVGTLDISILVVGGPAPGVDNPASAGTITVLQNGRKVAGGTVADGHRLQVHLPQGSYEVRASIGMSCPAVKAKAESGGVTPVAVRCDIK